MTEFTALQVDERTAVLEWTSTPMYRVEFWTGGEDYSDALDSWDVVSEDLVNVLTWLEETAHLKAPCKVVLRFAVRAPEPGFPDALATQVIHTRVVAS